MELVKKIVDKILDKAKKVKDFVLGMFKRRKKKEFLLSSKIEKVVRFVRLAFRTVNIF